MPGFNYRHWIVLTSCLILSGCTETIIQEAPQSGNAANPGPAENTLSATSSLGSGAVMVATDSASPADTVRLPPGTGTDEVPLADAFTTSATDPDAAAVVMLQQPTTAMVVGEPGKAVNCEQSLPCRWISQDAQFSLTVTNADNIASRDRLSVSYSIQTVHDTEVMVARPDRAIDTAALRFEPTDQLLGTGNGGTPQAVVAGIPLAGVINFDKPTSSNSLSQWSMAVLDGGLIRDIMFTDLPVGSVTTAYADCAFTLPCVWLSPEQDVSITLVSVGGFSTASRLSANFTVQTLSNMTVAIDSGANAIGSDGTLFEGRTHSIGVSTGYDKQVADSRPGVGLSGTVNFFRTQSTPSTLEQISLVLYQDEPTPRWNPSFVSVPVQ